MYGPGPALVVIVGVGLTMMRNGITGPTQASAVGVTKIKAVSRTVLLFRAVKETMLPVPLTFRPIAALSLVQVKIVPATVLLKVVAIVRPRLQSV